MADMIGRLHHVILDCPDPMALATFYSELLGLPVTYRSENFVVVAANDTSSGLAFQLAPDHQPPAWPDPARPQQVHFDVMVEDVAASGPRVLALGATTLSGEGIYADPAGHPFCLIRRPRWAPPIPGLPAFRAAGDAAAAEAGAPGAKLTAVTSAYCLSC
jgi:catechol 2,3-dioxygenase-like lactoylglutathione lyase family enzyme